MRKTLWLLILLSLFSASVWSQQKKTQPTQKTNPVKAKPVTTPPSNPPATSNTTTSKKKPGTNKPITTKKPPTKPSDETAKETKVDSVKADKSSAEVDKTRTEEEEENNTALARYRKDTATVYLTPNVKMGEEYISSRYTPPTITLLFINDLFDRKEKEMANEDFMSDKLTIGEKFYLNQQSISTRKKREFLEEIHKHSSTSLLTKLYGVDKQIKLRDNARWSDTTFSINKEKSAFGLEKLITKDLKSKLGKSLAGLHLKTNDTLGNAILYAMLKKDIPATTMKVWCDPKAVITKTKAMMNPYDLYKDPKKKLIYQELLKQNFILVMGFSNVHEVYENIYGKDNKGRTIITGTKPTGSYACDVRSFLYKIEMTPATLSNLGGNCETKRIPIRYAYRFYLQNFSMGAKHYTVTKRKIQNGKVIEVPEEVYVTEKQFNQEAIQNATDRIFEQLEKQVDEFKMRSGVMQVSPFYASEMGEKQGVYVDQRYDIYRYEKDAEKKEVNARRIASVRMTKIAKNSRGSEKKESKFFSKSSPLGGLSSSVSNFSLFSEKTKENADKASQVGSVAKTTLTSTKEPPKSSPVASGDSLHRWSHFRPITLGGIEKGDFLLQNDDKGITVQAGYNYSKDYPSLMLGLELNVNVLFKSKGLPSGIKLGAWVNIITSDDTFDYTDSEGKQQEGKMYFTIYAAKDFYLSRLVDVSPFVAYEFVGNYQGVRFGTQIPLNLYQGRVKLSPHVSLQTIEGVRPCFGAVTKFDF